MTVHKNHIDDILTGVTPKPADLPEETKAPQQDEAPEIPQNEVESHEEQEAEETQPSEVDEVKEEPKAAKEKEPEPEADDSDVDEYGNKVGKPRLYTDEDVQQMMKERFSRGHYANQQQQQQVQQATQDFKADPNNPDDWETQLEQFVEKTLDKVTTKKQQEAWQLEASQKQAEFEAKFTTGMDRYKDFKETVGKMPITDAILSATRGMKDPAAFLYAATKMQPAELQRIAAIPDPFMQATEIGRLEEKLRKVRITTKSAAPLAPTKGDISPKAAPKYRIEDRINQYAKGKKR